MASMNQTLNQYFPGAISIPELVLFVSEKISSQGFLPSKVKPAKATCRDDSIEQLGESLKSAGFLSPFRMETLAGHPVFGSTSVGAWYHHIPDNGIGVIFYGPHIGIDSNGSLGYLDRIGQAHVGKSCGAQHAMLNHFQANNFGPYSSDSELSAVAKSLNGSEVKILNSEIPILSMTKELYQRGLDTLTKLVQNQQRSDDKKFPVLIVGGVNVDTHYDESNMWYLKNLRFLKANASEIKSQELYQI
jgi:hypothetical protein